MDIEQGTMQDWAIESARRAFDENFSSRRGVYFERVGHPAHGVVVVYNNNPYPPPHQNVRDEEIAALRTWCAREKIAVLASASYPVDDDATRASVDHGEIGYTVALVLDAGQDDVFRIASAYETATIEVQRELMRK